MQEILRRFNGDIQTKEALLAFIQDYIGDEALDKMYKKEDVSHIADAHELIIKAFEQLETLYAIKKESDTTINQAR